MATGKHSGAGGRSDRQIIFHNAYKAIKKETGIETFGDGSSEDEEANENVTGVSAMLTAEGAGTQQVCSCIDCG